MRTTSILLTTLLILPILGVLLTTYSVMHTSYGVSKNSVLMMQLLSPIVVTLIFIVVAIILNTREKYLENSVMCGTILASFLLNYGLHFLASLLYMTQSQWLR